VNVRSECLDVLDLNASESWFLFFDVDWKFVLFLVTDIHLTSHQILFYYGLASVVY
jgi:hypothetical protein